MFVVTATKSVRWSVTSLLLVVLMAACGGPSKEPTAAATRVASPTTMASRPTTRPADLRAVDWGDVTVPGKLCFQSSPIQLHKGGAQLVDPVHGLPDPGSTGPSYVDIVDNYAAVRYLDLDPGVPAAFVSVDCNNNGGTADGVILYAIVVYRGSHGHLDLVGTLTPRVQPADELPTLLGVQRVTPGRISVSESWYRPNDGTCCPSGNATSTWGYSQGRIYPIGTTGGPTG